MTEKYKKLNISYSFNYIYYNLSDFLPFLIFPNCVLFAYIGDKYATNEQKIKYHFNNALIILILPRHHLLSAVIA